MTCKVSVALLEKQINILRKQLEGMIGSDLKKLNSPDVVTLNHQIDTLMVSYMRLK